ncbi:phage portal protein [Variovorax paradoxus]|uniref:Phage portal protein n=1 Tax=Variovorax paradoxus TaxID=34073 RepID=A0A679J8L0_VARPD|nr:hypothetical protein VVAX_03541 [Variovorax paradoxus]
MRPELKALADGVIAAVKGVVRAAEETLASRISVVEQRLATLPDIVAEAEAAAGRALAALPKPEDGKSVEPETVQRMVDAAVAALPAPKDGVSVTVAEVAPLVAEQVAAAVAALPKPQDGKDADPAVVAQFVREAVGALPAPKDGISVTVDELAPLVAEQVAAAVGALPAPQNGKDVEPEAVAALVQAAVDAIPRPKDGVSVTVEELAPLVVQEVAKAVAAIPAPRDGNDADPELVAKLVREAVDAVPKPKDGVSITPADVQPLIADEVAKAVAALPVPKDGESVPAEHVQRMVEDAVAKAVASIRVPLDGEPGRDAAHIEILPAIDAAKSYPRGTYARHAGGLWRSFETTAAMKGWECIVEGVAEIKVSFQGRTGFVSVERSSGTPDLHPFSLPAMIYRGVFREGETYEQGDTVTWGGSLWFCNEPTADKPLDGSRTWQLAAKRGRDGKDARDPGAQAAPAPVKLGT